MSDKTFRIVNSDPRAEEFSPTNQFLSKHLTGRGMRRVYNCNPEVLIAINHNKNEYRNFIECGGNPEKAFLLRLEPKSVYPKQFEKSIEDLYKLVITPGSVHDFNMSENFVGWPYMLNVNPAKPSQNEFSTDRFKPIVNQGMFDQGEEWIKRPKVMTMIAANKVSPILNSNYAVRRFLATQMDSSILEIYGGLWKDSILVKLKYRIRTGLANLKSGMVPNAIAIYGSLMNKYENAVGEVDNKFEVIKQSRFSLVIENCDDYVSEKLFDAIVAGSLPIYIGPSLESVGLPSNIALSGYRTAKEIQELLNTISNDDVLTILRGGREFLNGALFKEIWSADEVYEKISKIIITAADNGES